MDKLQKGVLEFHKTFDILINDVPTITDDTTNVLRLRLIKEELGELEKAIEDKDLCEIADAIGDILYVVYGTAVSFGIDMEPISDEIQRSNMTKVGGHKDAGGKWIKPVTYSPVDLKPIIEKQKAKENT